MPSSLARSRRIAIAGLVEGTATPAPRINLLCRPWTITVRIALVHNRHAGTGAHSADDLVSMLRDAGHVVEVFGRHRSDLLRALQARPEVLVIAGGDGTVA